MEVRVKESFKNKSMRTTWAGHVEEKMGNEKMAESRCPESGGEED